MHRRDFLTTTAALAGAGLSGLAQGGAPPAGQGPAPPAGRAGGRGMQPAPVSPQKLSRVSIMTLCFDTILKTPYTPNPTPEQTLTIFDLPQMYVDVYGVRNLEYQHRHLAAPNDSTTGPIDGEPAVFKELKVKLDAAKATMTQINLEFGTEQSISGPTAEGRKMAVERTKKWIDHAALLGCPRVMINQQQAQLNKANRGTAVAAWKEMADYGRTKKVMVSAETRGAGTPELVKELGMKPWEFLAGIIKEAGANSNVDWGNVGAQSQQELHECIKAWMPASSGNMHIKSSPMWDIGTGVRYTESIGYKALYSIEVGTHPAVRIVYNTILANVL
jgi:sugar phosphate isomerase/epimerase